MKLPSLLSIKKPCQDFDRSCKDPDRSTNFGKAPRGVNSLPSRTLQPTGKIVFYALADEAKGTNRVVSLSDSAIALRSGISRPAVVAALRRLCELKLIEKDGAPVKQVQGYRITHRMFGAPRGERAAPESEIKEPPVKRTSVVCPKCSRLVPSLLKVGHCRKCNWTKQVRQISEQVADERLAQIEAKRIA
jgi:DNA-binding Lrp family transcriptional regulator